MRDTSETPHNTRTVSLEQDHMLPAMLPHNSAYHILCCQYQSLSLKQGRRALIPGTTAGWSLSRVICAIGALTVQRGGSDDILKQSFRSNR